MTSAFWADVEARYRQRLDEEVARGLDPVELRPRPDVTRFRAGSSRAGISIRRDPRFSREQMVRLWAEGLNVAEVADAMGCDRATASTGLRERGIDTRERMGNTKLRTVCNTGEHRLEGENVLIHNGARTCRACKARRDRETWRRKSVRANLILHGPPSTAELAAAGSWEAYSTGLSWRGRKARATLEEPEAPTGMVDSTA